MQQNETAVRWGAIGLGGVVVQQIAPAILNSAQSRLVGCAGSTPEKTRAFAQQFGAKNCYASIEELAAAGDIEAFAQEVRVGAGVLASGDDGLSAIRIPSAVLESIQSRRSVTI